MSSRWRSVGTGTYWYALFAALLILCFCFGWFKPASVSKFENWMNMPTNARMYTAPETGNKAPKLKPSIVDNALLLGGARVSKSEASAYEYVLMPLAAYASEGADPAAWFAAQTPIPLGTQSVTAMGGHAGDVLYVRLADADAALEGAQPGNWFNQRIDGVQIGGVSDYSVFGVSAMIDDLIAFSQSDLVTGKIQPETVSSELNILRNIAAVLPYAAGLAVLLLTLLLLSMFLLPKRRKLMGTVAFGYSALLALAVVVGWMVINESFLTRESALQAAGTIKWAGWTGFLSETTLFPAAAMALSLIALFTLHYPNKRKMHLMVHHWQLYLLLVPAVILFAIFAYGPMFGVTLAFKEYHLASTIQQMPWVGLHWFEFAFSDPGFRHALGNSIVLSALHFLFGFPAPILLALMLNELRQVRFRRTVQTVTFMPQFLSWVVIGSVFIGLLSLDGPLNRIISMLGGKPIYFLGDPSVFRGTLIVTSIWKGVGYSSVVFLAAMSGVDPQLYECARLDGSTRLKNMWYITLPCISNIIVVMLILRLGSILEAGFDQIINMYSKPVYATADIIDTFIFRKVFGTTGGGVMYDYSAAVGLFKSVVGLIFIVGSNMLVRRVEGKEASLW